MRQIDGVIFEAIYYDVVCTLSDVVRMLYAHRPPASTYEADAVIPGLSMTQFIFGETQLSVLVALTFEG